MVIQTSKAFRACDLWTYINILSLLRRIDTEWERNWGFSFETHSHRRCFVHQIIRISADLEFIYVTSQRKLKVSKVFYLFGQRTRKECWIEADMCQLFYSEFNLLPALPTYALQHCYSFFHAFLHEFPKFISIPIPSLHFPHFFFFALSLFFFLILVIFFPQIVELGISLKLLKRSVIKWN